MLHMLIATVRSAFVRPRLSPMGIRGPSPLDDHCHDSACCGATGDRAIAFLRGRGWRAGCGVASRGGRVFYTADGGRTWIVQRSSASPGANGRSPRQLQFLDAQTGWVLFDGGFLHRTTDGGRTWQAIEVKPYRPNGTAVAYLKRFQMLSSLIGFGLNDDGEVLLRTTDGGLTWRTSPIQSGHVFYVEMSFLDAKQGWVSGNGPRLAKTDNGGQSWQALPPSRPNGANRLQFRSEQTGWFLEAKALQVYRTLDSGQSWQACGAVPNDAEINDVFFLTLDLGWAASDNGIVLRTTDGCVSWQAIQTPLSYSMLTVHFVDAQNGWAAGTENGVAKTADGGLTWTPVQVNLP